MILDDRNTRDRSTGEVATVPAGKLAEEEFIAWTQQCDEAIRAEWVDGEVVMMSPVDEEHADLNGWLVSLLRIYVEQHNLGRILGPGFTVRLGEQKRRRIPDILLRFHSAT